MKLRVFPVGAVLLTFLLGVEAGAHRHTPREVVTTFAEQWNKGKDVVDQTAELFEEEATLALSHASYAKGRKAIGELLAKTMEGTLDMGMELSFRELWHLAMVENKATLSRADRTQQMILTAVVVQTTDGPGQVDCQEGRACDEWSLAALSMFEVPSYSPQSR